MIIGNNEKGGTQSEDVHTNLALNIKHNLFKFFKININLVENLKFIYYAVMQIQCLYLPVGYSLSR